MNYEYCICVPSQTPKPFSDSVSDYNIAAHLEFFNSVLSLLVFSCKNFTELKYEMLFSQAALSSTKLQSAIRVHNRISSHRLEMALLIKRIYRFIVDQENLF